MAFHFKQFNDDWDYAPDEGLAQEVFRCIDTQDVVPAQPKTSLCRRCNSLDLLSTTCRFTDTLAGLESTAPHCGLCQILVSWCTRHHDPVEQGPFELFIVGSRLAARGHEKIGIATLCQASVGYPPRGLQLGFPRLPDPGSSVHLAVISHWLTQCNDRHECYPKGIRFFPTRLVDVGVEHLPSVHLLRSTTDIAEGTRYIALSHRWGSEHQKTLKTTTHNICALATAIQLQDLPKTFQDAVFVTRGLGQRFLWIDSLCIIQDDPADWQYESQRMEAVFSSAYCTIAATCASGTDDGFLKHRLERRSVLIKGTPTHQPYYICEALNDFTNDVDKSELNTRGWVLQERALARRTVHFTGNQTYWECGQGVRCETLTKMKNEKASLLGDSSFPEYAVSQSKGKKIKLLQNLYEQYSEMKLTFPKDRPIAIKGLETRLLQTVGGHGGYGVFEKHIHRFLLWQRREGPLSRINFPSGIPAPSWSWMAWDGGIEYMPNIPGGTEKCQEIHWPEPSVTGQRIPKSVFLDAQAWDFDTIPDRSIIYDEGTKVSRKMKCVALVSTKGRRVAEDKAADCYVLVIAKSQGSGAEDADFWERVGVGKIPRNCVAWSTKAGIKIG